MIPLIHLQVAVFVSQVDGGVASCSSVSHRASPLCPQVHKSPDGEDDVGGGAEMSPPPQETDSQYGTWETGLRTDDR